MSFITTNKFFNTGYGRPVRALLLSKEISKIINFEQVEVFEDILVSSVILELNNHFSEKDEFTYERFYKLKRKQFERDFIERLGQFVNYQKSCLNENEWSFSDMTALSIKNRIETDSVPLGDIDGIHIYRGVTTGFNPAFIIDSQRRRQLIEADSKNTGVIKNLLQGRNIRKWYYNESDEYLIFTRKGFKISEYPFIEQYLKPYYEQLKPKTTSTDMSGRKPGNYKWYEILDNTAYYPHFEKSEKIIWGLTADKWAFTLDKEQHYLPSNGYILASNSLDIRYVLGLLNSKLMHYYFGFIGVMTAGGAYTLKAASISALPFKIAGVESQKKIGDIVELILEMKSHDHDTEVTELESEIDNIVYQLYGLTAEEINIVENAIAPQS